MVEELHYKFLHDGRDISV